MKRIIVILILLFSYSSVEAGHKKSLSKSLIHAVVKQNVFKVKKLLKKGANVNVNVKNKHGFTPLHIASSKGNSVIVKLLLKNKAKVNVIDKAGWTAIHYAVKAGHFEVVKILVENKADLEVKTKKGLFISKKIKLRKYDSSVITPLGLSVAKRHVNIAKYLIEKGADINVEGGYSNYPLLHQTVGYNLPEIAKLLVKKGYNINRQATNGTTALHLAAYYGRAEILKVLIDLGADMNIQVPKSGILAYSKGFTPLHSALRNKTGFGGRPNKKQVEAAIMLIKMGCDINIKSDLGETALHLASWYNFHDVVKLLLKKGAKVNAQDQFGRTPLSNAVNPYPYTASLKTIQLLIEHGADSNIKDNNGDYAVLSNSNFFVPNNLKDIIEYLVKKGIDVNITNKNGLTLVHKAVSLSDIKLLNYLIKKGAKLNSVAINALKMSGTPLHFCVMAYEVNPKDLIAYKMAKILIDKGAKLDVKNNNGNTPLDLATTSEMKSLLKGIK